MSAPQDPLNQPPTDSVLRRHYEQLRAAQSVGAAPPPPAARPVPTPSPAPAAVRAAPAASAAPQSKGIRGWLGRLFGG